jgi:outer membrane protein assembly factor BamB
MRKIVSGVALWGMAIVAGFSVHSSFAGAQWPSYQFDAANSGKSPYAGVTNPTLRWTFHVNANLWASSAIGPDGTIYFGAQDATLYALGKNGKLK